MLDRRKNARYRAGSARSGNDWPFGDPDFPPAAHFRTDADVALGYFFDIRILVALSKLPEQPLPLYEATGQSEVHQAEHIARGQAQDPLLEVCKLIGNINGPDQGANGGPRNHVRANPQFMQGFDDADMCPASCGSAAQCQADDRFSVSTHVLLTSI